MSHALALAAAFAGYLPALVLLAAAVAKLGDRSRLALVILNYQIVPQRAARWVARVLPELELLAAALMLAGVAGAFASLLAALLFLSFTMAIGTNLLRGRANIACGCFGPNEESPLSWTHALGNVALALGALLSLAAGRSDLTGILSWRDKMAAALAAGVALVSWWLGTLAIRMWRRASVEVAAFRQGGMSLG